MPTPSAGRRPVACGSPMRDPAREAHGAAPLVRAGGQAPLPGFPASPRPGPALCGDLARAVAGAGRLAGRRVQVRAARPLDRPGAGAAVPASRPEREQHPVFGSRGARRAVGPRPALSRGADPPALPRPVSVHGHGIPGSGPSGIRNCTAAPCTGPRAGTARAPPGARPRQRRLHRPAWKAEADARRPPPRDARRLPARLDHPPPDAEPPADPDRAPRGPATMRPLHAEPAGIQDWRRGRGGGHTVARTPTVTVPATLANMRGCSAAARSGKALWRGELAAIGAWRNKKTGLSGPPAKSTIHRALAAVDPEAPGMCLGDGREPGDGSRGRPRRTAGASGPPTGTARDTRDGGTGRPRDRGAGGGARPRRRWRGTGRDARSAGRSDIRGRAITPGALHTVRATARPSAERRDAACVFTGRASAPETHDTPGRIDREPDGQCDGDVDRAHSRIEQRRTGVPTPGPGTVTWPGIRRVARVRRRRESVLPGDAGKPGTGTFHSTTPPGAEAASPRDLPAPTAVTGPWRARPPRARHGSRRGHLPDRRRERFGQPRRHGHDRVGRGVRRPPRGRGRHRSHAPPAAHPRGRDPGGPPPATGTRRTAPPPHFFHRKHIPAPPEGDPLRRPRPSRVIRPSGRRSDGAGHRKRGQNRGITTRDTESTPFPIGVGSSCPPPLTHLPHHRINRQSRGETHPAVGMGSGCCPAAFAPVRCSIPQSSHVSPSPPARPDGRPPVVGTRRGKRWVPHSLLSGWHTYPHGPDPVFPIEPLSQPPRRVYIYGRVGQADQSEVTVVRPAKQHPVGCPTMSSDVIHQCFAVVRSLTLWQMLQAGADLGSRVR